MKQKRLRIWTVAQIPCQSRDFPPAVAVWVIQGQKMIVPETLKLSGVGGSRTKFWWVETSNQSQHATHSTVCHSCVVFPRQFKGGSTGERKNTFTPFSPPALSDRTFLCERGGRHIAPSLFHINTGNLAAFGCGEDEVVLTAHRCSTVRRWWAGIQGGWLYPPYPRHPIAPPPRFTVTSLKHMLDFALWKCWKHIWVKKKRKRAKPTTLPPFHLFHPSPTCGERRGHASISGVINAHMYQFLFLSFFFVVAIKW